MKTMLVNTGVCLCMFVPEMFRLKCFARPLPRLGEGTSRERTYSVAVVTDRPRGGVAIEARDSVRPPVLGDSQEVRQCKTAVAHGAPRRRNVQEHATGTC